VIAGSGLRNGPRDRLPACLTLACSDARPPAMTRSLLSSLTGLSIATLALGGCITVKAPDKPIEINLNINVKQEVVVSLKKDAEDFIANNPDLFPK
jgi:hypothetical protein